jgi:hypothetical protein
LGEHPRDVPLRDMTDLVREHRRQLALGLGRAQQAGVDADEAAGQRERVDRVVGDREELEAGRTGRGRGGQRRGEPVQVVDHLGVVEVGRVAADLPHDRLAEPPLGLRAELVAGRLAELGQVVELRARGHRAERERGGQRYREHARPDGAKRSDHVAMIGGT